MGEIQQSARFRPDIEGLRAVAVVLVVAFHAGVGAVGGGFVGVDVFFVVSGFLITGLLVRELEANGTVSLRTFYARRARRLLPLAAATLVVTAVVVRFVMSPVDITPIRGDISAASFYFANWHFAAAQTNYMNAEAATSPLLHFWSLAVEEQFYVIWPLLLLVVASRRGIVARIGARASVRMRVGVLAAAVLIVSFYVSVVSSATQGPVAYYGLHTRAFELAAGAILAAASPALARIPRRVAAVVGWIGVGLIVASALLMTRATVFPGSAAAVPVVATMLVIVAGFGSAASDAGGRGHVARVLGVWPLRYVGRISYAWYLTHWPALILVSYAVSNGGTHASWPWTVAAVVGSFALAALAHRIVEMPVRHSPRLSRRAWRSLAMGVSASVVAATVGVVMASGIGDSAVAAAVSPMQHHTPCNLVHDETRLATCTLGDRNGASTVAFFGDSHAAMWAAALDRLGKDRHMRVVQLTKEGCEFSDVTMIHPFFPKVAYTQCSVWRDKAYAYLRSHPVQSLIVVRSASVIGRIWGDGKALDTAHGAVEYAAGFQRALTKTNAAAGRVVVIEDTPFAPFNVLRCVANRLESRSACDFPRAAAVHRDVPLLTAEASVGRGRVDFADITPTVCPDPMCHARMPDGNVLYWDSNHLTDHYTRSIAGQFGNALDTAVPAEQFHVPSPAAAGSASAAAPPST